MTPATLKSAFYSALLILVLAYPVLDLRLTTVGTQLQLTQTSPLTLYLIATATLLVFFWQLFRLRVDSLLVKGAAYWKPLSIKPHSLGPSTQIWLLLGVVVCAFIWPFFASRGGIDIATLILIYIMLGLGLNIVVGLAGLLDLGYVGFYAVGAYTYALLSHYFGLGFWTCLPLAGLFAAVFGFVLGFPVLRIRGDYLAIVTLGFGEIIRILLLNMSNITGGPNGIGDIEKPTLFGLTFERTATQGMQTVHDYFGIPYQGIHKVIFLYLMALLLVLLILLVVHRILRMPIGRAWQALRDDEIACRSLGINPTTIKLSAFTLGATFAGFAGSFFAARQGLVTPESFSFIESAMILAIVVLGGMGSQLGIILAATVIILVPELLRDFSEYRMLIFGALMVLMMIWRPQGLLPTQRPKLELPS